MTATLGELVAPDQSLSLNRLLPLAVGIAVFFAVRLAGRTERRLKNLAILLLLVGVGAALLSLVSTDWQAGALVGKLSLAQYFPVLVHLPTSGVPSSASGNNPRVVAGAMAIFLTLALALAAFARQPRVRLLGGLAAPVFLLPLALTQSPQGVLALFCGLGLVAAWRWPRVLWVLAPAALAAVITWLGWRWWLPASLAARLVQGLNARLEIWPTAFAMLRDAPFTGVGLNNFPVVYTGYVFNGSVEPHAHNVFLQTAADQGVPGLVAFVALFAAAFVAGWRAYRHSSDADFRAVMLGCAGGAAAFLGYGLWDSATLGYKHAPAVWAMLGLLAAGQTLAAGERLVEKTAKVSKTSEVSAFKERTTSEVSRRLSWALIGGLAFVAVVASPIWGSALCVNVARIAWTGAGTSPAPNAFIEEWAGRAAQLDPGNGRAYLLLGLSRLQQGQAVSAAAVLEQAVLHDGADPQAHFELAEAYNQFGQAAPAVAQWRAAGAGPVLLQRSARAQSQKAYAEAERWAALAAQVDPNDYRAPLALARALRAEQQYAQAAQAYAAAIRLAPQRADGYGELAELYSGPLKDPASAQVVIEQGLAALPAPDARLYYLRSHLAADQKQWPSAEQDAQTAVQAAPGNGAYLAWLGDLYLAQQRYPEALAAYDRAALQAADKTWQWRGPQRRGQVYAAQANWPAAIAEFLAAVDVSRQQGAAPSVLADNYVALGNVLARSGDAAGALSVYQAALNCDGANAAALQRLAELKRLAP